MQSSLYGSLVLAATTPLLPFPMFNDARTLNGNFTGGRYRGSYSLLIPDAIEHDIALPQRGKYIATYTSADPVHAQALSASLARLLPDLDSRFEGARQLYKSQQLMNEIDLPTHPPYVVVINNMKEHPYFNVLVQGVPLYLFGVFDSVNRSVRLVFTTDADFVEKTKALDFTRYVFYRFALVNDRPIFMHTQSLCSRWYFWARAFRGSDGILKCFNLLEHLLLKDSNIQTL
jgi:hypothetical protein